MRTPISSRFQPQLHQIVIRYRFIHGLPVGRLVCRAHFIPPQVPLLIIYHHGMRIMFVLRLMCRDVREEIKRRRREGWRGRHLHLLGRGRHILQWARVIRAYIIEILLTIVVSCNGGRGSGHGRGPTTMGLFRFRRPPYSPVCSGCSLGIMTLGMATQDITET